MITKEIMFSLIIFFSSFVYVYSQPSPEEIARKHDRIVEAIKERRKQGIDVSQSVLMVRQAEAIGKSLGGSIPGPESINKINSLLDEAEELLNQQDSSGAIALAEKLESIKQLLQERAKKDDRIPLILQETEVILKAKESGRPKEALGLLEEFKKKWQIKNIHLYYSGGDSAGEEISVIFKGEVSPAFIKEAHYISLILGKIGETEGLIRAGDHAAAGKNIEKLEKMARYGPAYFSNEEKEWLYKKFKDFYGQAAQKYFTHNLTEPLTLIEGLYPDLALGYLAYKDILGILNQAEEGLENALPLSEEKKSNYKLGKILPPEYGAVFGMWNVHDLSLLSEHSQAQGFLDKTGQESKLENIVLIIQDVEGNLCSLDEPMMFPVPGESYGLKIGPTIEILLLRTWANGEIPLLELHPHEHNSVGWYLGGFGRDIPEERLILLQDIIEGKIDGYLKKQAEILKKHNRPLMFRTINEFNAYAALWPVFGRNGRTSLFDLINGEGTRIRIFKAARNYENVEEIFKQVGFDNQQVYNNYGDANIPDGPERIRDVWKHIRDVFDEAGAPGITWVSQTAPEHGAPNPLFEKSRNWNRMRYYWPGRNYVDWGGVSGYNEILEKDKNKRGTLYWTAQWWKEEIEESPSEWGGLPNILYEFSQIPAIQKRDFQNWIKTVMSDYLPGDFKNIKALNWISENIPLDTKSEIDTFKKYVTDNPYWQAEFRFGDDFIAPARISDLTARQKGRKIILSWTAPGDEMDSGGEQYLSGGAKKPSPVDKLRRFLSEAIDACDKLSIPTLKLRSYLSKLGLLAQTPARYYIIKYRARPIDDTGGLIKDFRSQPWRIWSRYETKDIEGELKPALAGKRQYMEIAISSLSPSKAYYFGIQSVDDAPYNSRISNIAEIKVE